MNASAQPLIKLDGIKKVFYTDEVETHALAGIHLEIAQGEYVAIAGPSGCGKSTLLAILGLLDTPTEEVSATAISVEPSCRSARLRIARWVIFRAHLMRHHGVRT